MRAVLDGPLVIVNLFGSQKYDPPFYVTNGDGTKTLNAAHNGVDFRAPLGSRVYAVWPGVVKKGWDEYGWGNYAALWTEDGREAIYGHLSAYAWPAIPDAGIRVAAGQFIALSGNSGGMTTGPHLHFSIREKSYQYANGFLGFRDPLGGFDPDVAARFDFSEV